MPFSLFSWTICSWPITDYGLAKENGWCWNFAEDTFASTDLHWKWNLFFVAKVILYICINGFTLSMEFIFRDEGYILITRKGNPLQSYWFINRRAECCMGVGTRKRNSSEGNTLTLGAFKCFDLTVDGDYYNTWRVTAFLWYHNRCQLLTYWLKNSVNGVCSIK